MFSLLLTHKQCSHQYSSFFEKVYSKFEIFRYLPNSCYKMNCQSYLAEKRIIKTGDHENGRDLPLYEYGSIHRQDLL